MQEEFILIDYLAVLWGWRRFLLIGTISAAVTALGVSMLVPKTYEATTTLMVSSPNFRETGASGGQLEEARLAKSYEGLVRSRGTLLAAIETYNLREAPYRSSLESLEKRVAVSTIKDSNLLTIRVEMPDPDLAASIANFVAQRATEFNDQLGEDLVGRSQEFIRAGVEHATKELETAENEVKEFRKMSTIAALRKDLEVRLERHGDLEKLNLDTQVSLARVVAGRKSLEQALASLPRKLRIARGLVDDALFQQSLAKQAQVDPSVLMDLSMVVEEINPTYTTVEAALATARVEESGYVSQREEVLSLLEENLKTLGVLEATLAERELKLVRLEQVRELALQAYQKLSTAYSAAQLEVVSKSVIIDIVDLATPPDSHIGPRPMKNAMLGGVAGGLTMVVFAFLAEFVRRSGELSRKLGRTA